MRTLFVLLFACFISTGHAQDETTLVKISDEVPSFDFEESPGVTQNISAYKGKVVLITFFATWCGPCRKELPSIQSEIFNKYKNDPNFVLLIFGREHSWKEVSDFRNNNKFTMPFFPDPERKIFSKFATQSIPRNFLVSKDGKIVFNTIGFEKKDFKLLKDKIDSLLKMEKKAR
jgi:thiol-disulfide isomerase/thioredoxin